MNNDILIQVNNLHTVLPLKNGQLVAPVDGVNLTIPRGKTVGLVGESGCGKSMTARSLMRLLDHPIRIQSGSILYYPGNAADLERLRQSPDTKKKGALTPERPLPDGAVDITALSEKQMRSIRGHNITMIFQEPMTALNPSITVGKQVREAILLHEKVSKKEATERVLQSFRDVGIPEPERRYKSYPHQLSGGLRQRICIAMAMVLHPEFLIADEPTTALDVTVEAQILALMKQLQHGRNMSILMITHNLGVVADICDEVNVMYAGQIVEYADKAELFRNARHPYTQGLMEAIPRVRGEMKDELYTIEGTVPSFGDMPKGCRFCDRCPYATDRCRQSAPQLRDIVGGHLVRCFREVER
ncbi:ABC transporter ATP-binding protein [uncultured Pseudoflavonifractor sp.]|uniref:ABC transporter ATP-binding protein n=1 Tax=uncultured Pseudoflavonifractor sp. TaxID=1221379 RepID=UPI0025CBCDBE|nr:ABC transporter ATP-binding protein [uncultured Pseudoflavonifractor sp.]